MGETCELWELEVTSSETAGGSYTFTGSLWRRPVYPSLSPAGGDGTGTADSPLEHHVSFGGSDPRDAWAEMVGALRTFSGGDDDRRLTRLTLELPASLESHDWEGLAAPNLVVRRLPGRVTPRPMPSLSLPLRIGLLDRTGPPGSMAQQLYDDSHLHMVRDSGIQLVDGQAGAAAVPILHVAASAGDPIVGSILDSVRMRTLDQHLLVLQTDAPVGLRSDMLHWRHGAILEVDDDIGFARALYRKLLHDWPIDRSVAFALRESHVGRYRLWGRGGDRLPLLTTAVLELAGRLSLSTRDTSGLETVFRGGRPTRTTRGGGRGGLREPARPRSHGRVETVTNDLKSRLDAIAKTSKESVAAAVDRVRQRAIDFTQEDHGVRAIVDVQRGIAHAAAVVFARELLDDVPREVVETALGRMTSVWLRDASDGRDLRKTEPAVKGRDYALTVRIGRPVADARVAEAFPEEALVEAFRQSDEVELDVVVFAPAADFDIPSPLAKLKLPRVGDSEPIAIGLRAVRAGACRLRTCIYAGTRLLQSLWLEARVVEHDGETANPHEPEAIRSEVDYAATGDFALLGSLPAPEASIVINDAPDGTHWLGVYAPNAATPLTELNARLFTIDDADVRTTVGAIQVQLANISLYGGKYRFTNQDPTPEEWTQRERLLVTLAREGRRLCRTLLGNYRSEIKKDAAQPGVMSIGRCRGDKVGIPWGVFYDYGLDVHRQEAEQSVCAVFSAQARSGTDQLDDPVACRAQASCPLNTPGAEATVVCPFGFWGARHQVEVPLHHTAKNDGEGRTKIRRAETVNHVPRVDAGKLRVACGRFDFGKDEDHPAELNQLMDVEVRSERDAIVNLLRGGGFPIVYFFCHGKEVSKDLVLQVGPPNPPQYIGADTLDDVEWTQPQPLVFLNGCDTVAFKADVINGLTTMFRGCGASGVIGTEFSVPRLLARAVGGRVLERLASGATLGRALLDTRRELLRQMNPLGLAYTAYASAWLHYAPDGDCAQCNEIGRSVGSM